MLLTKQRPSTIPSYPTSPVVLLLNRKDIKILQEQTKQYFIIVNDNR